MIFSQQHLADLLANEHSPCVSLYMPMYAAGREQRQNSIRFRNLMRDAESLLTDDPEFSDATRVLERLQQIDDDESHPVWQHPRQGLALFATPEQLQLYPLPYRVDEQVHVGDRFYVKPLLRLLQTGGRYLVIAVSQNSVRLFEGIRDNVEELPTAGLPKGLRDALNIDEFQTDLQYYSFIRSGDSEAIYHGRGAGEDDHKSNILQYFQRLDEPLSQFLAGHNEPLVFAGVEYLYPIFKEAISYSHLVDAPASGNFDEASTEEIAERAWPVVESHFQSQTQTAVEAFQDSYGQNRACTELSDLIVAASRGAVGTLLLRKGAHCWGQVDVENQIVRHEEPQETSLDLLDEAAYETLRHGGEVFVLEPEQFPGDDDDCVAILRYPVDAAVAR